jgi:hypothetical protein
MRVIDGAAALLIPERAPGEGRVGFDRVTEYCGVEGVLHQ